MRDAERLFIRNIALGASAASNPASGRLGGGGGGGPFGGGAFGGAYARARVMLSDVDTGLLVISLHVLRQTVERHKELLSSGERRTNHITPRLSQITKALSSDHQSPKPPMNPLITLVPALAALSLSNEAPPPHHHHLRSPPPPDQVSAPPSLKISRIWSPNNTTARGKCSCSSASTARSPRCLQEEEPRVRARLAIITRANLGRACSSTGESESQRGEAPKANERVLAVARRATHRDRTSYARITCQP